MLNVGVVGAKGFLGSYVCEALNSYDVVIHHLSFRVGQSKSISIDDIKDTIKGMNLNVIINCSAFIGFENCFSYPFEAYTVNSILPFKLGLFSENKKIRLIHISTEAVFPNGKKFVKYSKLDSPNPETIYGKSKHKGEILIRDLNFSTIIRLPRLFSANTQIVAALSKKIFKKEIVKIADDLISTPIHVKYAAKLISEIAIKDHPYKDKIIHITGDTHLSLHGLISKLINKKYLQFVEKSSNFYFNQNPKEPPLLNCGLVGDGKYNVNIDESVNLFLEESK